MERKKILEKSWSIDFEGSIDEAISMLLNKKQEGWTDIGTKYTRDYVEYFCYKYRPETDDEYNARLKAIEDQKNNRRKQYEELKKEFGE